LPESRRALRAFPCRSVHTGCYFLVGAQQWIALVTVFLKPEGHLEHVTRHIHDLAKFMFGFSIFWTILVFTVYVDMVCKYPEEITTIFITRIEMYNLPFSALLL
jgi:hypothetical protein